MPKKGTTDPALLPNRIRMWLQEHPGEHRARDVANGLGRPEDVKQADWSRQVATALSREVQRGNVSRTERTLDGWTKPTGLYFIQD